MGHCGKDMISPKDVMVDLKCSLPSNSQDRGLHLQAHVECLQHHLETIESLSQPIPSQLLTDNFPVHWEDPPLPFERTDFSRRRNQAGQVLQGLRTGPL
jgi:hypothetical protein